MSCKFPASPSKNKTEGISHLYYLLETISLKCFSFLEYTKKESGKIQFGVITIKKKKRAKPDLTQHN